MGFIWVSLGIYMSIIWSIIWKSFEYRLEFFGILYEIRFVNHLRFIWDVRIELWMFILLFPVLKLSFWSL